MEIGALATSQFPKREQTSTRAPVTRSIELRREWSLRHPAIRDHRRDCSAASQIRACRAKMRRHRPRLTHPHVNLEPCRMRTYASHACPVSIVLVGPGLPPRGYCCSQPSLRAQPSPWRSGCSLYVGSACSSSGGAEARCRISVLNEHQPASNTRAAWTA